MNATPLRVLVVDDSALYRKVVRDALIGQDDVQVVGTAHNGQAALDRILELRPDLLTLDVEMPELDGLSVLKAIRERRLGAGAIMCSSSSAHGASVTTQALELGAFDFVLKPDQAANVEQSMSLLRSDLLPKIRAFRAANTPFGRNDPKCADVKASSPPKMGGVAEAVSQDTSWMPAVRPEIVVIGVSTGGPAALSRILPQLPADLPVPVLIVQHMPPLFTKSLADDLRQRCRVPVSEAIDGCRILPGQVLIAPGGKQMKVGLSAGGLRTQITDDPPERNCKPAADYLFRSVAMHYGGKTLGIVLTGMGDDGTEGCRHLRKCNATVLAQSAASCVVYGMPRNVVEQGLAHAVVDLDQVVPEIMRLVSRPGGTCR